MDAASFTGKPDPECHQRYLYHYLHHLQREYEYRLQDLYVQFKCPGQCEAHDLKPFSSPD